MKLVVGELGLENRSSRGAIARRHSIEKRIARNGNGNGKRQRKWKWKWKRKQNDRCSDAPSAAWGFVFTARRSLINDVPIVTRGILLTEGRGKGGWSKTNQFATRFCSFWYKVTRLTSPNHRSDNCQRIQLRKRHAKRGSVLVCVYVGRVKIHLVELWNKECGVWRQYLEIVRRRSTSLPRNKSFSERKRFRILFYYSRWS